MKINSVPDFEKQFSYPIRLRATESGGLYFEKVITLRVNNVNEAPSGLQLWRTSFDENIDADSVVASLRTTDPDTAYSRSENGIKFFDDTFTYSLRWSGFSGQSPSLASEAGHRP